MSKKTKQSENRVYSDDNLLSLVVKKTNKMDSEWKVAWFERQEVALAFKYFEGRTYYTDDKADALGTMKAMIDTYNEQQNAEAKEKALHCNLEQAPPDSYFEFLKAGLCSHSNSAIYISRDSIGDCWNVFKTTKGGCQATQLFSFETDGQAWEAAKKIAEAIGGEFYGKTDPRKI